ncbi:MAG: hypothetical protein LBL25_03520 [Oscillospiraceae bacterium]|jgi:hypothetical protein|nr:hypothetical protein [Oscillospiraceae bacterium]
MLNTNTRETSVKYTAVLPAVCLAELKILAEEKAIASVSHGIRLAVESFVSDYKRRAYEEDMREAASDKDFLKRTLDTQAAFSTADAEGETEW